MSNTIQIKGAPSELRSRLEASAARNFRSINQEALARIEMSFAIEDSINAKTHQQWVDEALKGSFQRGSISKLKAIANKAKAARR